MELYHIHKLGIAILFYAIWSSSPIITGALSTQQNGNTDDFVYYQGVQGKPGVDFPVYARIPKTSFSCKTVESGYYADLETNCQVFHICNGGAKISFLCPNGTIFQQSDLICEWWFKVNCTNSPNYYSESAEQLREESWRRKNYRKSGNNKSASPRAKSRTELSENRKNEILHNGFNNKLLEEDKGINILDSRSEDRKDYEPTRFQVEELRKKQVNGDRGGRRFKQTNNNNINVRNEITDGDSGNSDEAQVPQETASFYKNTQNILQYSDKPTTSRYPNHKETYSEIQQPKFYSTKAIGIFSQTIPPQTYSTNRIPLNDGKPFVVSTPKSSHNIQLSEISNSSSEYNRVTTESFRYSPTVPPFTTLRKSQLTTIIPKIIVDADSGVDVNDANHHKEFTSTIASHYSEPTQSKTQQEVNHKSESTSANSNKSISFTERINTFSGLDDIIHTPTTDRYNTFNVQIDSVSSRNGNNSNSNYETSTIDSYKPGIPPATNSYTVDSKTGSHSVSFPNQYNSTTNDNYFPAIIVATSVKYGANSEDSNNYTPSTSPSLSKPTENNYYQYNVDTQNNSEKNKPTENNYYQYNIDTQNNSEKNKPTENNYYQYNIDTQNNSEKNKYQITTKDSYNPSIVKSSTATYGVDVLTDTRKISTSNAQQNPSIIIQVNETHGNVGKGSLSNNIGTDFVKQNHPPSVYTDGNQDNLVITYRNIHNNKHNVPNDFLGSKSSSANTDVTTSSQISSLNEQKTDKDVPEVVQNNDQAFRENKGTLSSTTNEVKPQSSYGDACEDDIVYSELPKDQIVVGKSKIVIDDTTVPSTETNVIKITVNNVNSTADKPSPDTNQTPSKSATDSTIFRINVKYGQEGSLASDAKGFYVTRQFGNNDEITSPPSTQFWSKNTYLPKGTFYPTSTDNYDKISQTKSHTYLPKRPTATPFSVHGANRNALNNKDILRESNNFPQSVITRQNHLKTSAGVPQISEAIQQEFALKPKPFELPPKQAAGEETIFLKNTNLITSAPLPEYKVSSARPFSLHPDNTIYPTLATPFSTTDNKISEHLQNMLNTLNEIINERSTKNNDTNSSRPGLLIPPSVGPQTLHTLAVYFANALDGISSENSGDKLPNMDEAQAINQLLTHSTINRYRELFKEESVSVATTLIPEIETEESNDLEGQHSKTAVTPRVRQLANVFTKALSSYLDDPDMFKKALEEARPTEPPTSNSKIDGVDDEELLSYSDADIKPNLPRLSTTTAAPIPTWGYILASNNSNSYEYNSLNPDKESLQSSDSQSFASQFTNYIKDKHFVKEQPGIQNATPAYNRSLPFNHWTSSANATKLWQDKLYTNPQAINEDLNVSGTPPIDSRENGVTESNESFERSTLSGYTDITYGETSLPKMDLNSTQVHKILVDIVNSSRNEGSKLKRILHKLNTTQEDFLTKMREIEQNPLTRRLILLLISECGSDITHLENYPEIQSSTSNTENKRIDLFESSKVAEQNKFTKVSSPFPVYVDPSLKDEDEDNRALQLLNSLYTIAAKYGK